MSIDFSTIPSPLPGQTFADGSEIPSGLTFAQAYDLFLEPVRAWDGWTGAGMEGLLDRAGWYPWLFMGFPRDWRHGRVVSLTLVRSCMCEMDNGCSHRWVARLHTRNGHTSEHYGPDSPGRGCRCLGCANTFFIPSLHGYVSSKKSVYCTCADCADCAWDPDGNSDDMFFIFEIPEDRADEVAEFMRLRRRAKIVERSEMNGMPWLILGPNPSFKPSTYMGNVARDTTQKQLIFAEAKLAEDERALAENEVPAVRPPVQMELRARFVQRRKVKQLRPTPSTWSQAQLKRDRTADDLADRQERVEGIDRALSLIDLPASVAEILGKERKQLVSTMEAAQDHLKAASEDCDRYLFDLAGRIDQDRARVAKLRIELERLEFVTSYKYLLAGQSWPGSEDTLKATLDSMARPTSVQANSPHN